MNKVEVIEIEIDEEGKLHLKPKDVSFAMVYRLAKEVNWNNNKKTLYSPKPREWSYFKWFQHIFDLIDNETIYDLYIPDNVIWINIPKELKNKILSEYSVAK